MLDEMAQYPALQVDGKFDYAYALSVLKAQGRSVSQIEKSFRRDVKLRELDQAIGGSSFATATEVKRFLALTRQQRELAWFTLSAAKYAEEVKSLGNRRVQAELATDLLDRLSGLVEVWLMVLERKRTLIARSTRRQRQRLFSLFFQRSTRTVK